MKGMNGMLRADGGNVRHRRLHLLVRRFASAWIAPPLNHRTNLVTFPSAPSVTDAHRLRRVDGGAHRREQERFRRRHPEHKPLPVKIAFTIFVFDPSR